MQEHLKQVSDIAFDVVDNDHSGYLDASELCNMMEDVAIGMGA